ncbi:MAG: T9SS type A sorting domain-containing protein [Bacteroidetes bacterium]|nr:MAG: T9SS type A sorting domain-containing protein [Bacteroidota bacterium]
MSNAKHFFRLACCFCISVAFGQNNYYFENLGSPNGGEEIETIIQTSDSSLVMVGGTDAFSTGENLDVLVVKTTQNGDVLWSKTYGGDGDDMALDVKETLDSGLIIVGWTKSFGAAESDFWIIKTDRDGNVSWQKKLGGSGVDQAWSISLNGPVYYVCGGTNSFGAGATDLWSVKLDTAGNILWQNCYGTAGEDSPGGPYGEYVARGLVDQNGHFLIGGVSDGDGHGGTDMYLAKLNPNNGNIIWQYAYGDTDDESMWNFSEAAAGGYFLPGNSVDPTTFEADLWVIHVDTSGAIKWQNKYGIPNSWDEALNITSLPGGSFVLSAYYENSESDWTGSTMMINSNGNLGWAKKHKQGHLDWINDACVLYQNTLAFVGVTTDTTDWNEDAILFRTAGSGEITDCEYVTDLNPVVETTATGKQSIDLTMTPTLVIPENTSAQVQTVNLNKNSLCSTPVLEIQDLDSENELLIYPNPSEDKIQIKMEMARNEPSQIQVIDFLGKEVLHQQLQENQQTTELDLSSLEKGIYTLRVQSGNASYIRQIIKE